MKSSATVGFLLVQAVLFVLITCTAGGWQYAVGPVLLGLFVFGILHWLFRRK